MVFFKRIFSCSNRALTLGAIFVIVAGTAAADTVLFGGVEDHPGKTDVEGTGDYNDMIFKITGNISFVAPGSSLYALNASMVNESGNIFWDHPSGDGAKYNFGYCMLGTGNCAMANSPSVPLEYLAESNAAQSTGAAPLSVMLQAAGLVTFELMFEKTGGADTNTMGWFDPVNPAVLHQIFSGPDGSGTTVSFIPTPTFGLYFTTVFGQFYSSIAAGNLNESTSQQHFAFLSDPPAETPEPGTLGLGFLALAGFIQLRTRQTRCKVML